MAYKDPYAFDSMATPTGFEPVTLRLGISGSDIEEVSAALKFFKKMQATMASGVSRRPCMPQMWLQIGCTTCLMIMGKHGVNECQSGV